MDEDTGLYYFNARWYDQEVGRFITEDSYHGELNNPQTLNLYVYVAQNPMRYVDPTGNKWTDITTVVVTYADSNIRTYSAKNQEMKVSKFTAEVDIPNFGQRLVSNITSLIGIKWWNTTPRKVELQDSYGYEIEDIIKFNASNFTDSELGLIPLTLFWEP